MGDEELAAALRRCLYLASRPADKRVVQAGVAAYQYLLRVAAGAAGGKLEKHPLVRGGGPHAWCTYHRPPRLPP